MTRQSRLQQAQDLLAEHIQDFLPKSQTHVKDVELSTVDAYVCNLVACLIKHEGQLDQINEYYSKCGLTKDFNRMIQDAQTLLDGILPELIELDTRQYFARLSKMSVVIAEICFPQAVETEDTTEDDEVSETSGASDVTDVTASFEEEIRQTADLDESLLEFRKLIARKRLEEQGMSRDVLNFLTD